MDQVAGPRRASSGLSFLVALGWYATVVSALAVGWSGVPAAPRGDCPGTFCPTRPQEMMLLLILGGAPVLLGLLVVTLVLTGLLARRLPSPILTGTLSAVGSVVIAVMVAAAWWRAR